ncbi:tetratricopeptide repeat protein [Vibrio spartinae]|uniref:Uncharacterized protein n=1 Tax=Vibrio spartinae TaxID=1918945 RepID=A0A1N6M800_9VIBR|nr:hypothetical protein [Vibrio spartinae]QMV14196.1 hypothetical protein Vspart_01448 [Vibrio spartinae]SIO95583.1 hypothetical protein VSP9026_03331 [Vibrio spartinae]
MMWMTFIILFISSVSSAESIEYDPLNYIKIKDISKSGYIVKDLNEDGLNDFIIKEKNSLKLFLSEVDDYTSYEFFVKSDHFGLSNKDNFLPNNTNGFNLWFAEKNGVEADVAFLYIDGKIKSSIGYYKISEYDVLGNRLKKQMYVICDDFSLDKNDVYSIMDKTLFYKDNHFSINESDLEYLLKENPINKKNLIMYSDTANILQKKGFLSASIYLLGEIVRVYPSKTTAYENLGDAYWVLEKVNKAKDAYRTYIELMKKDGKESKISEQVLERVAR